MDGLLDFGVLLVRGCKVVFCWLPWGLGFGLLIGFVCWFRVLCVFRCFVG